MLRDFFWFTLILGLLKWIHSTFIKKEADVLGTISLVYTIVVFIILLIVRPDKEENVALPQIDRRETPTPYDQFNESEGAKEFRESLGTGILDDVEMPNDE